MTGITVLGPVAVGDDGSTLSPRDRVVLSVLVARRGREVPADTLAEALWGEDLPASWHKVVQGCVARLRRRLGHEAIVTGRDGYRLTVPAEDVDAGRFERLVRRARELLALDHADQAAYAADEALALWRGTPLAELVDWAPGRGEAERLDELRKRAEELRLDALLASGRHAEVIPEATLRVQQEPLREHRWALLARAQYQDGRQAEALATLRRARETLAEELGLDPGADLVALEHAVLTQDPALTVPAADVAAAACPWPGLAAYDVEDADSFFGRDAELAQCLERLDRSGFLAVVGPSGSGKSSLVRAGLAARLQRDGRRVRIVTPDPRPLDTLAAAVVDQPRGLVLIVDQCEEIFSSSVPTAVRHTFLDSLAEQAWSGRTDVVLTLRADRLGDLAAFPDVARRVEEGLYLLKGIGPEGLRAAIEQPARQAGLLLEQGLVDLLVRDVEGEPGSLPLLAHALRETWHRREGTTLTVEGYRASGGIRGAVAQSAERVYEQADEEQRHALRELLLRLVQAGPGGEPVRTSVDRDVLGDERQAALVEQLVRARLVTAHTDRLEIAHESLGRAWPRLQAWLADDVQGERIRHHLSASAHAWDAMGRPVSELYRGARLAAAREWRDSGAHGLTSLETRFLQEAERAHASRLARAEADAHRQRRLNRRLQLLVVGTTIFALLAAGFGLVAREQWQRGQAEAARARAHELSASSLAALEQDSALAKALAVLGAQAAPSSFQSRDALHRALAGDRVVSRLSMSHTSDRLWAVLHPDGDRVAMSAESVYQPAHALEVHDARTGELIWEWVRPEEPGYASVVLAGAQYSPDGAVLAGGVLLDPGHPLRVGPPAATAPAPADGTLGVHLWDARTHELLSVVDVGPCGGWPVAIGGDRLLVRTLVAPPSVGLDAEAEAALLRECRWDDGAMGTFVVDSTTGESRLFSVVEALNINLTIGHALTHDGSLAAVPDFETSSTLLVDTSTYQEVGRLEEALGADFDASGERLLTGRSGTWRVVSVPDLTTVTTFTGHEASSFYGRFGPGDTTVYTSGLDNVLLQWDATSGQQLSRLPATGSGPPTTSGDLVLVPRPDTAGAVLVDASPPGELWSAPSCQGGTGADRLRVAGDLVVVGRDCDGETQGRLQTFTGSGRQVQDWPGISWEELEPSPDGRLVVSRDGAGSSEGGAPMVGPLRVRDLATGEETVTLEGFCRHTVPDMFLGIASDDPALQTCGPLDDPPFTFSTWALRWSPDGRWIVALSETQGEGLAVWDAATGDLVATLATPGSPEQERWETVWDARFSPGSDRLVLSTWSGGLVTVDTKTWEPVTERSLGLQDGSWVGVVGHAADGSLVLVNPLYQNAANTSLLLADPDSLEVTHMWSGVAEGTVHSAHVSPNGTRVALATSEGVVNVWDLTTRALVDRADPGLGRLDGVQWLDDQLMVLLSADGHLSTVTTEADRLLDLARGSLTRGLTQSECASYLVEPCLGLAALRGSAAVVPEGLRGTYALEWSSEGLRAAAADWAEQSFGELDQTSVDLLHEHADLLAGSYRLELGDSDYTITKGQAGEVWCTGAVTRGETRPDRLLLGADSGTRCVDFHYAEVGWRLDGDQLVLPRDQYRGSEVDRLLWTSKPLQRVG